MATPWPCKNPQYFMTYRSVACPVVRYQKPDPGRLCSLQSFSLIVVNHFQTTLSSFRRMISGCRYALGMIPIPTALRMALAIFRWLTRLSPVSEEDRIRPISVIYSDMIEKFLTVIVSFVQTDVARIFTVYCSSGFIDNMSKASTVGR